MSSIKKLKSGSALDTRAYNRELLDLLINGDEAQKDVVATALQNNAANDNRFAAIENGMEHISLSDLARVMQALEQQGMSIDTDKLARNTPMAQQSFYDALAKSEYGDKIMADLQRLRDEAKAERGFLKTLFNINANEKPLEAIAESVIEFELYCQKNNISFEEATMQLGKRRTTLDKIKDFKFLIAAIAGTAAGVAGMDPAIYPVLNKVPGMFFTALPFFAVPFIGLNTFKAFSQRKLAEEAGTFLRFAGIMVVGVTIGFTALSFTAGSLGTLDTSAAAEQAGAAAAMIDGGALLNGLDKMAGDLIGWAGQYSPGKILLPVIGTAFGLSFVYKAARDKGLQAKNALANTFSKATVGAGDAVSKFTEYFDKAFMGFINTAGVPAIFLLLSTTLAQGGFEKFSEYSGYYATVGLAMAGCATAIGAAAYAYGQRAAGFKNLFKTFATAFSLSSSSATMPVTKKALAEMGVRPKIRDAVVPLGATFNMMGTSLYLGMTAVAASMMMGNDPSFLEKIGVMATAIATAFGAPGIPASSIAFMTPVLETLDMTAQQMTAVFAMILLMDRPFDMFQTGLNVTGDMTVALDTEADARGGGVKNRVMGLFNKLTGRSKASTQDAEQVTEESPEQNDKEQNDQDKNDKGGNEPPPSAPTPG